MKENNLDILNSGMKTSISVEVFKTVLILKA